MTTTPLSVHHALLEKDVTVSFLDALLREREMISSDNRVVSAEMKRLDSGGNTGAAISRIALKYEKEHDERKPPPTLVFKYANTAELRSPTHRDSAAERAIIYGTGYSDVNMLILETRYYTEMRALLCDPVGVDIPRALHVGRSGRSTRTSRIRFVAFKTKERVRGSIVMEDVGGGTTFDAVEDASESAIDKILVIAGKLHGHSARLFREGTFTSSKNEAAGGKTYIPAGFNYKLMDLASGVSFAIKKMNVKPGLAEAVMERWGKTDFKILEDDPQVYEALKAFCKRYASRILPTWVKRRHQMTCVLHGDLHAGNFRFYGEGPTDRTIAFDFQMWGTGPSAWELAYFFTSNVPPSAEGDEARVRKYHAEMEKAGGVYPLDLLRRDVKVATCDMLAAAMVRRGKFESPAVVAKQVKKDGRFALDLQRVCTGREVRMLMRLKSYWLEDKELRFNVGGGS